MKQFEFMGKPSKNASKKEKKKKKKLVNAYYSTCKRCYMT
jgi:hypothetical protein